MIMKIFNFIRNSLAIFGAFMLSMMILGIITAE
jgi:hypothetical protein